MNWTVITDFGDAAVTVPIALAIAAWLASARAWRGAFEWLLLFGTGAFLVLCTKVAYAGWGLGVQEVDFTGISGHSMGSTSVLTVVGYFVGSRYSRTAAIGVGALGYGAGVLIGISRVILGDHSPSEVIVGCALGGAIAVAAIAVIGARLRGVAAPIVFALTVAALVFALHGHRAPASERLAIKVALYLSGRTTPFTRELRASAY